MDDPEGWRWVWLVGAVVLALGEMASPGSFFLAPFALGAAVAAVLAFAEVDVVVGWVAFVVVSVGCFLALRPLARRLDAAGASDGVGSRRLIGRRAEVLEVIAPLGVGTVRVDREEWRAVTEGNVPVEPGTIVVVTAVEGTKVVVAAVEEGAWKPE